MNDATEILKEKLNRVADEAWEGTAEKQKLLVNRNFRLDSVELVGFVDQRGNDAESYVATLALDGEADTKTYWLGGRLVMPQVKTMLDDGDLPVFLTLIEDTNLQGQPYRLVPAAGNDSKPQSGHPHLDALVEFCRSNGLANEKGNVNPALLFEKLDITLPSDKPPSEAFKTYLAGVARTAQIDAGADEIYRIVLEDLVLKMGLKEPEPEPEFLPFE